MLSLSRVRGVPASTAMHAHAPRRRVNGGAARDVRSPLRSFGESNATLCDALEDRGVRARSLVRDVFEAKILDESRYGLVGRVKGVHMERVRRAVKDKCVPVICSIGSTPEGQALNINADVAAAAMAVACQPLKVLYVNPSGGMKDGDGRVISVINLAEDYERLLAQEWCK